MSGATQQKFIDTVVMAGHIRQMTFKEWVDAAPHGTMARIHRATGVSRELIYAARREPVKSISVARRLSEATGGAVSIAELLGLSPEEASVEA